MSSGNEPTVTFGPSAAGTVVEQFGWAFDDGTLVDAGSGDVVESLGGREVTIDSFAGIVPDEDGEPTPLADNFNEIVDHVKRRQNDE